MMKQQDKVKKLAVTGLLSALVFIFSWIQVPIGDVARLHLGNVFCALSGLLFGPIVGGIASGFGSMLFDFTNPAYIAESWITFITKFAIGFLAGLIAKHGAKARVGLWTVPRTGYTRVIGNCNGSGRWRLSDSLKQRERGNSPCAPAVLLYSIYTPRQ